jgi:SAM-dependent methyltransferase
MKRCLQCASRFATDSWECPHCHLSPQVDGGLLVFAPDLARAIEGYEPALFEAHGGEQAERSFWTGARAALIIWALNHYATQAGRFLEIGCGTGGVLARVELALPDLSLVGGEALIAGLRVAQTRLLRTQLMQFDARSIPFDGEFDAVGAFDVIEHIPDDDKVLASMAGALRPGGILLVTVPQHPFLFGPADVAARHVRRYTTSGLVQQVQRLGLRVECATSFTSVLFPVMAAVRLLAKWRGGPYDSAEEFEIGPLNGLFARIMDLERWTIRHGMRWPVGGSLMLVARKSPA